MSGGPHLASFSWNALGAIATLIAAVAAIVYAVLCWRKIAQTFLDDRQGLARGEESAYKETFAKILSMGRDSRLGDKAGSNASST